MTKHWQRLPFEDLFSLVIGGDWGKELNQNDTDLNEVYCIRGSEIRDWNKRKGNTAVRRKIALSSLEKRRLQIGDILLEISGGGPDQPVGRTVIIDKHVLEFEPETPKVCTNFLRLVRLVETVDSAYVNYYLTNFYITGEVVNYQGGSNNLRNLKFREYSKILIPLPPLAEQKLIVAKLDTLFGHLNELKARLEKIPILLKQFRQAVLTQAVTGKLTEEWRGSFKNLVHVDLLEINRERERLQAENAKKRGQKRFTYKQPVEIELGGRTKGVDELFELPDCWKWASLDQVVWSVSDGPHFSPTYVAQNHGVAFISARNISYERIDFSDAKYVSRSDHNEFIQRGKPEKGDILLTKGGTTGIAHAIDVEDEFSIWVHVALLKVIRRYVSPEYLRDVLTSDFLYKQSQEQTHGVGNQDLGLTRMVFMTIPLPPIEEQKEIVRRVKLLFGAIDQLEIKHNNLKEKIDQLPQAILAKAFRGELVLGSNTGKTRRKRLPEVA